jgi:hypothetical protein
VQKQQENLLYLGVVSAQGLRTGNAISLLGRTGKITDEERTAAGGTSVTTLRRKKKHGRQQIHRVASGEIPPPRNYIMERG